MEMGADISWLSTFPHEKEVLYPPLTCELPHVICFITTHRASNNATTNWCAATCIADLKELTSQIIRETKQQGTVLTVKPSFPT